MDISPDHRRFLENHRLCIVGFSRKDGPPSLTPVYYAMDGDEIVMSTTADRAKAKAVERNPQVSLCILDEKQPFAHLLVYGEGRVDPEGGVDAMLRSVEAMSGNPIADAARAAIEQRAKSENRIALRVKPTHMIQGGLWAGQ